MLLSHKKKGYFAICDNMDEHEGQYATLNKPDIGGQVPLIREIKSSETHRGREWNGGCQGLNICVNGEYKVYL